MQWRRQSSKAASQQTRANNAIEVSPTWRVTNRHHCNTQVSQSTARPSPQLDARDVMTSVWRRGKRWTFSHKGRANGRKTKRFIPDAETQPSFQNTSEARLGPRATSKPTSAKLSAGRCELGSRTCLSRAYRRADEAVRPSKGLKRCFLNALGEIQA